MCWIIPSRSGQQILLGDRVIVKGDKPGVHNYCTHNIMYMYI